jgi:hypothetical protein
MGARYECSYDALPAFPEDVRDQKDYTLGKARQRLRKRNRRRCPKVDPGDPRKPNVHRDKRDSSSSFPLLYDCLIPE